MQNPLKMLGDLNQMRKHAKAIQDALEKEEYTVTEGNVEIVISGNQKVKSVTIDGIENNTIKNAVNSAIKQSQQAAAGKLGDIQKMME